jgi:glycosyltransferase involved in cell wall biosynthesis
MTNAARRLLAVSWDMPPQSGPRAVQVSRLLRELVPHGWHSDVVCFGPRSNRYFPDPELARRLRLPPEVTRVPVRSLEERLPIRALWRVCPPLKRLPDEKRVWIGAATQAALRLAASRRPDVLVTFAQPWSDHLIGLRLKRTLGLPWVAHFSDPWVEAPEGYSNLAGWQRQLWRRWERAVIDEATAVVFVNRQTADATMQKYPAEWAAKAHVVPHGFDAGFTPRSSDVRGAGPLQLTYTGRFYGTTRTPAPLFRALAKLAPLRSLERQVRVKLVGTIVPEHQRLADALGVSHLVEFTGRVDVAAAERYASEADVLLIIDAPSSNSLFLPSKLIDYLPLGKPILGITPSRGAAADVIHALGYTTVDPDDEAGLATVVAALIDRAVCRRVHNTRQLLPSTTSATPPGCSRPSCRRVRHEPQ